jgi:hypothetical protein
MGGYLLTCSSTVDEAAMHFSSELTPRNGNISSG